MRQRSSSNNAVTLGLLLAGAAVGVGCNGGEEPEKAPAQAVKQEAMLGAHVVVGPAQAFDKQNDMVVEVPAGWSAVVPDFPGTLTLNSYDVNQPRLESHSNHIMRADAVKVDLSTAQLPAGMGVEQWAQARLDGRDAQGNVQEAAVRASAMVSFQLTQREAYAYKVQQGNNAALEVVSKWGNDRVLLATVYPASTQRLTEVVQLMQRLQTQAEAAAGPLAQGNDTADVVAALEALPQPLVAMGNCTTWTGSETGSYASNSPITLNLPFQYGTWWQAGGGGSFWGNYMHGNCNNDYFAIDFNMATSSTCGSFGTDAGQPVYAAANGTAAVTLNSTSGYGNFVMVTHGTTGIKTRYAHLASVPIGNGAVTTQTVIGYVGNTGPVGDPHLHFGFYQSGYSHCNRSGGCPNGEAALSPQSAKPGTMYTALGSKTMADYGCYQAPP